MNDSYQVNYLESTYFFRAIRGYLSISWTVADSTNNRVAETRVAEMRVAEIKPAETKLV